MADGAGPGGGGAPASVPSLSTARLRPITQHRAAAAPPETDQLFFYFEFPMCRALAGLDWASVSMLAVGGACRLAPPPGRCAPAETRGGAAARPAAGGAARQPIHSGRPAALIDSRW